MIEVKVKSDAKVNTLEAKYFLQTHINSSILISDNPTLDAIIQGRWFFFAPKIIQINVKKTK